MNKEIDIRNLSKETESYINSTILSPLNSVELAVLKRTIQYLDEQGYISIPPKETDLKLLKVFYDTSNKDPYEVKTEDDIDYILRCHYEGGSYDSSLKKVLSYFLLNNKENHTGKIYEKVYNSPFLSSGGDGGIEGGFKVVELSKKKLTNEKKLEDYSLKLKDLLGRWARLTRQEEDHDQWKVPFELFTSPTCKGMNGCGRCERCVYISRNPRPRKPDPEEYKKMATEIFTIAKEIAGEGENEGV